MNTTDAEVMKIYEELIVLDGTAGLLLWGITPTGKVGATVEDPSGKGFDYYIQGGFTGGAASISGLRVDLDTVRTAVAFYDNVLAKRGLVKIRSAADVQRAKREKKFGIWYHMQSSNAVEDDLDALEGLKKAGLGQLQFAYNYQNRFANGCLERLNSGISKAGIDLVKECNELKIILDGSHQGYRDVLDLVEFSSAPVIVSHANALAVYKNQRNIPDGVMKAVAQKGGFVGANGVAHFISDSQRPTFDQFFAHIDHMVQLVGFDHVGIGLDYFQNADGVASPEEIQKLTEQMTATGVWGGSEYGLPPYCYPAGLETPKTVYNLTGGLLKRGYSKEDVAKIMGGNYLRVMKEVWG
jgi:membrane dipeptidase